MLSLKNKKARDCSDQIKGGKSIWNGDESNWFTL